MLGLTLLSLRWICCSTKAAGLKQHLNMGSLGTRMLVFADLANDLRAHSIMNYITLHRFFYRMYFLIGLHYKQSRK